MPHRCIGILILLLVSFLRLQAQGEVVFSIDSQPVERAEFVYHLQRSNKAADAFLHTYIDYKLKVREAENLKLDRTVAFQFQYQFYAHQLLKAYMVDSIQKKSEERHVLFRNQQRLNSIEWVKIEHISIALPQQDGYQLDAWARTWMDSVYSVLCHGTTFKELKKALAQKVIVCPKDLQVVIGELSWMPINRYLKEWTDQINRLEQNKVSEPFFSPKGIHIVKWVEKRSDLSWEEKEDYTERFGVSNPAVDKKGVQTWEQEQWSGLIKKYPTLGLRLQDIHDGLLVATLNQHYFNEEDIQTDQQLEAYFQQHREFYRWDLPHFKGAIIHAKDKKTAKSIKKALINLPMERWQETFDRMMLDKEYPSASIEMGLYEIGKHAGIDKYVFKCGDYQPFPDMPYTAVIGKKLKKGPDCYKDVEAQVKRDFQLACQDMMMLQLREKYQVEVNSNTLKTVNNNGSM